MTPTILIAIGVLHLLALIDVWASRLSRGAQVLWSLLLLCMPVVGLAVWLLTRHTAYQPESDFSGAVE